ncbi:MAG: hypothetical protein LBH37_00260 [Oscillospiraceae bacterium]|jgi:lipopolysaccharide biosynthesis glycosyltransferase|nr:hypothetical protein [Oscillospiraceae bacterium]
MERFRRIREKISFRPLVSLVLVFFGVVCFSGCSSSTKEIGEPVKPVVKRYRDEVPVVMPINDDLFYQAVVSISSLIDTAEDSTCYKLYALTPGDFSKEKMEKLRSLEKIRDNCRFEFIDMDDKANNPLAPNIDVKLYKFAIVSALLGTVKKCIYLDPTTLVCGDLAKELFREFNLSGKYVAGVKGCYDFIRDKEAYLDKLSLENFDHYIDPAILLFNLEDLRKDKVMDKFKVFLQSSEDNAVENRSLDRDVLNSQCGPDKILILPLKFNVCPHRSVKHGESEFSLIFSQKEWEGANSAPIVVNFLDAPGPWEDFNAYSSGKWWGYAKSTGFFEEFENRFLLKK